MVTDAGVEKPRKSKTKGVGTGNTIMIPTVAALHICYKETGSLPVHADYYQKPSQPKLFPERQTTEGKEDTSHTPDMLCTSSGVETSAGCWAGGVGSSGPCPPDVACLCLLYCVPTSALEGLPCIKSDYALRLCCQKGNATK